MSSQSQWDRIEELGWELRQARKRIAELEAEVAGYKKLAQETRDATGERTVVIGVFGGNEIRIFSHSEDREIAFAQELARWWKLIHETAKHILESDTLQFEAAKARAEEREAIVGMLCKDRDAVLRDDTSKHNTAAVLLDLVHRIQSRAQEGSDG